MPAEHYIIVRVRDDRRETMTSVRRSLHDHASEYGLDATDIVLSSNAENTHYGLPVKPFFEAVQEMFEEHQDQIKAVAEEWRTSEEGRAEAERMALQEKNPAAQKKKRQSAHRDRARRALKIVRRYETTYGEAVS